MKIRPVEAELFFVDGQTDEGTEDRYDEANIRFWQFCGNAPKTENTFM
jgi:hypothetical protein